MAFNPENYPENWKEFSKFIRFERAGNRCEKCGIENGSINERGSKVVLTVAHLDYEGGVCQCLKLYGRKCANENHVLALCQKHHLEIDRDHHVAVRRKNLIKKKDAERGLFENFTVMDFV